MEFNIFIKKGLKVLLVLGLFGHSMSLLGFGALPQDSTVKSPRVQILKADVILRDMVNPDIQRLVGGVELQYKEVLLSCDSAWRFDDGRFKTMGRVRMRDKSNALSADVMEVDPTMQSTIAWSKKPSLVIMEGEIGESQSPVLFYDMAEKSLLYEQGGTLTQKGTRIEFQVGQWIEANALLMLGGKVSIDDGKERIHSDSLHLLKSEESIRFLGESVVLSADSSLELHCSRGLYQSASRSGWFGGDGYDKAAWIRQEGMLLQGDSLVLPSDSLAPREAWGHVVVLDSQENWQLEGAHAKQLMNAMTSEVDVSILVGDKETPARLMDASGKDTLFLVADTLQLMPEIIRAWPKVQLEQGSSKATCDTLIWSELDSLIQLNHDPLLWMQGQFLRADSVTVHLVENTLDRLHAWGHAGLMYPAGDSCYQQIAGRDLQGIFREGKLNTIDVSGNAELVYFNTDTIEASCDEFNRSACSRLRIEMEEGVAETITLLDDPSGLWTSAAAVEAEPSIESLVWKDPPPPIYRRINR